LASHRQQWHVVRRFYPVRAAFTIGSPVQLAAPATGANGGGSVVGLWRLHFYVNGQLWDQAFETFYADGNEMTNDVAVPPAAGNICWGTWTTTSAQTVKLQHFGWNFDSNGSLSGTGALVATITVQGNTFSGNFSAESLDLNGNPIPGTQAKGALKAARITVK
jgi:hypothetical protein